MKVTLISPHPDIQAIGIRTLSASLKREGYDVQILFLPRYFMDRYEDKTLNEVAKLSRTSDLIGISLMTNFFDNAVQLTGKLKETLSVPVLWGGIHPTIRPAECLDYADIVCMGEGEKALVELARRIKDGQDYHDVQNMAFKNNKNIRINKIRPLIQDLDSIPFPDYNYETHYILDGSDIHKMDENLLKEHLGGVYMTMPTRGCPFGCTYCCNNTLNKMYPNQNPIRKRNPDNIIKELVEAKSKLPFIECIKFDDDAFFIYTIEEIREFCEKYKRNIGLPLFITGSTPSTLTKEKLSLLVDAGLKSIRMGIQTGSERTKRLYNRHHSNQQVEKATKIINEFKDKIETPLYDIILDNPWETEEDLIETLMFLAKLPTPYNIILYSLTFYPETELYRRAKREGIITDDLKDVYRKYYHGCKRTYLNRLFFLLNDYASGRGGISLNTMSLLTNRKLRQLRLSWLLHSLMLMIAIVHSKVRRLLYVLHEGVKDIRKGDWYRIIRYAKNIVNG